jgi:hypothetical protein
MQFETWADIDQHSRVIAEQFFWYPDMDQLQQALSALPNHVDNLLVEAATL